MKYETSDKPLENYWIDGWNTGRFNTRHADTGLRKSSTAWQNGYLVGLQERERVSPSGVFVRRVRKLFTI